jgi:hypothetical protein
MLNAYGERVAGPASFIVLLTGPMMVGMVVGAAHLSGHHGRRCGGDGAQAHSLRC